MLVASRFRLEEGACKVSGRCEEAYVLLGWVGVTSTAWVRWIEFDEGEWVW